MVMVETMKATVTTTEEEECQENDIKNRLVLLLFSLDAFNEEAGSCDRHAFYYTNTYTHACIYMFVYTIVYMLFSQDKTASYYLSRKLTLIEKNKKTL